MVSAAALCCWRSDRLRLLKSGPPRLNQTARTLTPARSAAVQVGLDAAGKTTILYKLKLGEIVTTIPTIGEQGEQGGGDP